MTNLELYLIFPLNNEESTIALVRGTMATGAVVLLGLLAAIALVVSRQIVLPVRSASRIAERFAEGHLTERMPVRGEDDMARLAVSFNDMAESLSRQITQLEEFGNLQRRFTSDVSHELRTPLTTVRMAADLIYDHSDDLDPALRRSTELMVSELDRFESLLNDLLEISRHDAGVAELSVESVDLRSTVQSALDNVGHLAADADIELIVDMPAEAVIAEVDPRRVERILRNLIANAIDHAEHKPVRIRMAADEDTVAVTVRDYGVGLRPGEEKLVFSRFWRSDPSRVRRSGGTGLGLAISIEDARLHQGRLEAWGEPGKGACFRLTLPLVRGHKVTTSPLPMKPAWARTPSAAQRTRARTGRGDRVKRLLAAGVAAAVCPRRMCRGARVRRRRRRSAPWNGLRRRACPSRRRAWIPTYCCANSSRPPPIPRTGIWPPGSSSPNRHPARWDDAGSALLIDNVVFVETRGPDRVSVNMRADILGSLSDMGVFETGEGALPDPGPIELVKTSGGWRIDKLPNGVFLDWQQFQSTYKRNTLYFADPTGNTVVPDPRYVAVSDPDQLATELVSKLIAGPRPEMANSVRNLLGPPLRLRGPVTRADGGKMGIGRGYGGARIDLENLSTTDPHSRQLLAAQLIWTLSRAGVNGPYVINADGAALDDRFADGWETSDVAATDPGAASGAAAGLHGLVGGSMVSLDGQRAPRVPGSFGQMPNQTAAALSRTGQEVASIVTLRPGAPDMASSLWVGTARQQRVPGSGRPQSIAAQLVARRRDMGCGRRQQRGARHPGRVGSAGSHTRGLHAGVDEIPRRDRRAAAVARRDPRRDGHRRPGDPDRRGTDTRRRIRTDLSATAGLRAPQHRGLPVVAHGRRHRRQPDRSAAPGLLRQPRRRQLRRAEPQPADAGHHRGREPVDGLRRRRSRRAAAVRRGSRRRPGVGRGASADGGRCDPGIAWLRAHRLVGRSSRSPQGGWRVVRRIGRCVRRRICRGC